MPNARTHCPYCNSRAVIDLAKVLRHRGVAFFMCRTCRDIWHVPKDQNGPPSQDLLRLKKLEVDTSAASYLEALSFPIDDELAEGLRLVEERDGVSKAEQIRRGIRLWLESKNVMKLERKRAD